MKQDGVQHHTGHTFANRVTAYEAAEIPDVAIEAIRERVQRGNAPYEQHEEGPVHVLLDAVAELRASFTDVAGGSVVKVRKTDKERHQSRRVDELIESLQQDQMAFLRDELAARDEQLRPRESHRKDHAIAAPREDIPELPSEALRGLEMATMGSLGRAHSTSERPQVPRTRVRRPWWQEMFE